MKRLDVINQTNLLKWWGEMLLTKQIYWNSYLCDLKSLGAGFNFQPGDDRPVLQRYQI